MEQRPLANTLLFRNYIYTHLQYIGFVSGPMSIPNCIMQHLVDCRNILKPGERKLFPAALHIQKYRF